MPRTPEGVTLRVRGGRFCAWPCVTGRGGGGESEGRPTDRIDHNGTGNEGADRERDSEGRIGRSVGAYHGVMVMREPSLRANYYNI